MYAESNEGVITKREMGDPMQWDEGGAFPPASLPSALKAGLCPQVQGKQVPVNGSVEVAEQTQQMGILWFGQGEGRDVFELEVQATLRSLYSSVTNGSLKVFPRRVI